MIASIFWFAKRRPVGSPLSWGEAMAAGLVAMFPFLWWYGVIPHQWLTYAEGELSWRTDSLIVEPTGNQPLTITLPLRVVAFGVAVGVSTGIGLAVSPWAFSLSAACKRFGFVMLCTCVIV